MSREGTSQMAVLTALEADRSRTVEELSIAVDLHRRCVVKAAGRLIAAGLAERTEVGRFTLTADGVRFLAEGKEIKPGPKSKLLPTTYRRRRKQTFRDRLWKALRLLRKASVPQLMELAGGEGVSANSAHRYLAALAKAGYLREMPRREPGTAISSNGYKRYQLLRDSGPLAPQFRDAGRAVFDPNTQEIFSATAEVTP